MDKPASSSGRVYDELHPLVHKAAAGLLIWFVVAAWLLFSGGAAYLELALAMVSMLVFMALAIPTVLWRAGAAARRSQDAAEGARADAAEEARADADERAETSPTTFSAWLRGRFATWTDVEKPSTAAIEVLLPLAAVAFGLTAIGIVFQLARAGV
jgi:ABC-type transport system involved in cytochrome bd biosynthesis fused ATPase/permease subunit